MHVKACGNTTVQGMLFIAKVMTVRHEAGKNGCAIYRETRHPVL